MSGGAKRSGRNATCPFTSCSPCALASGRARGMLQEWLPAHLNARACPCARAIGDPASPHGVFADRAPTPGGAASRIGASSRRMQIASGAAGWRWGSAFDLRCRARCSCYRGHVAQVIRRRRMRKSATGMVSRRCASAMKVRYAAAMSGGTLNVRGHRLATIAATRQPEVACPHGPTRSTLQRARLCRLKHELNLDGVKGKYHAPLCRATEYTCIQQGHHVPMHSLHITPDASGRLAD